MEKGKPIVHFSTGRMVPRHLSHGMGIENAYNRAAQYAAAADPKICSRFTIPLDPRQSRQPTRHHPPQRQRRGKDRCTRELAAHLRTLDPFRMPPSDGVPISTRFSARLGRTGRRPLLRRLFLDAQNRRTAGLRLHHPQPPPAQGPGQRPALLHLRPVGQRMPRRLWAKGSIRGGASTTGRATAVRPSPSISWSPSAPCSPTAP
jgi:hypothetical protein